LFDRIDVTKSGKIPYTDFIHAGLNLKKFITKEKTEIGWKGTVERRLLDLGKPITKEAVENFEYTIDFKTWPWKPMFGVVPNAAV